MLDGVVAAGRCNLSVVGRGLLFLLLFRDGELLSLSSLSVVRC